MKQTQPIGTPSNPNVCGTIKPNVKQSDETIKMPKSKIPTTNGTPRNAEITSQKETTNQKLERLQKQEQSTIQNFRENLKKKLSDPNQNQELDNATYEHESIKSIKELLEKVKEHLTEQQNLLNGNGTVYKTQLTNIENKLRQIENYQKYPLELAYEIECSVLQEIAIENITLDKNESQEANKVKQLQLEAKQQLINCPNAIANVEFLESLKKQINYAQKQTETARQYVANLKRKTSKENTLLKDIKNQFNQTKDAEQIKDKKEKKQKEHRFTIDSIVKQTKELETQLTKLISAKALYDTAADTYNTKANEHNEYYSQNNITKRKEIIDGLETKHLEIKQTHVYKDLQVANIIKKQHEEDNFLFGNQKINANKNAILWYASNKSGITKLANDLKKIDTEQIQENQKILNTTVLNNVINIIKEYDTKISDLNDLISSLQKQYEDLIKIAKNMQKKAISKKEILPDHIKEYDEETKKLIDDFLSTNKLFEEMKATMLNKYKEQHRKILAPTKEETEEQTRQYDIKMQNMTNMANQFKKTVQQ